MECLTILPGHDKRGTVESFLPIHLKRGQLYTIVGNTGSGKSRLIKDVEQLAQGDSVTGRTICWMERPYPAVIGRGYRVSW